MSRHTVSSRLLWLLGASRKYGFTDHATWLLKPLSPASLSLPRGWWQIAFLVWYYGQPALGPWLISTTFAWNGFMILRRLSAATLRSWLRVSLSNGAFLPVMLLLHFRNGNRSLDWMYPEATTYRIFLMPNSPWLTRRLISGPRRISTFSSWQGEVPASINTLLLRPRCSYITNDALTTSIFALRFAIDTAFAENALLRHLDWWHAPLACDRRIEYYVRCYSCLLLNWFTPISMPSRLRW